MSMIHELSQEISKTLQKKGQSLCAAESCTGGLVSSAITDVQGASQFFRGSVVSYTNEVKIKELKVPSSHLQNHGPYNKETAEFMAKGVKSLLGADWSLSITGLLELSGGLEPRIFTAVSYRDRLKTGFSLIEGPSRKDRKQKAALFALDFFISQLKEQRGLS